jgi:hypothetical protein
MSLITRQQKGSKLTIQEMDGNLEYLQSLSATTVLTDYPTTDATKVGQKFIYKGNEWKYHSQAELDDLGWSTVSEGFPAPVSKAFNPSILFEDKFSVENFGVFGGNTMDFLGYGNPAILERNEAAFPTIGSRNIEAFRNVNLLFNLKDAGTTPSITLGNSNMSAATINDFFTQLPATTETATINVSGNPGSATCDPSIATTKGYTVVT